jgi:hypothetical protein
VGGDSADESPTSKRPKSDAGGLADDDVAVDDRLRLLCLALREQFEHVEATYEARKGTFEITTDVGLEPGASEVDGDQLTCLVEVTFDDVSSATVRVTCEDKTLASNVQACLRNLVEASLPIETGA